MIETNLKFEEIEPVFDVALHELLLEFEKVLMAGELKIDVGYFISPAMKKELEKNKNKQNTIDVLLILLDLYITKDIKHQIEKNYSSWNAYIYIDYEPTGILAYILDKYPNVREINFPFKTCFRLNIPKDKDKIIASYRVGYDGNWLSKEFSLK